MTTPPPVTIVVNGTIVPSFTPARVVAGRVVAPLGPIIVRLGARISIMPGAAGIEIERDGRRVRVRVAFVARDLPYVELAPLVRALGGSTIFDPVTKTLSIALVSDGPIATSAPFDPASPRATPTAVFTPTMRPEPPRPIDTGSPRPRRTAIPAAPSQPVEPNPLPTSPLR